MVAAKTVWIQTPFTGWVPATAGQTVQKCCYLYAPWHEDWPTLNIDMTCKDSFLRQNNLFLVLKKMWKHTYSPGKTTSVQHCIMCKVAKIQPDPKSCPTWWPKPLSLLKITHFLLSGLNIFKANQEIFTWKMMSKLRATCSRQST